MTVPLCALQWGHAFAGMGTTLVIHNIIWMVVLQWSHAFTSFAGLCYGAKLGTTPPATAGGGVSGVEMFRSGSRRA
jgi:hypothetical protein